MKKIQYILFFISVSLFLNNIAFAESKLDKIKSKIQAGESKLADKVWGTRDCSQYSTKTLAGLAKYKRCKSGLKPLEKKSWKHTKEFDPNKPCDEYSTKTFTGLLDKMKCKKAKKN